MKLWRNNRRSGEWELSNEDIAARFLASKFGDFDEYPWRVDHALPVFIGDPEGLSSSFEPDDPDYDRVIDLILEARRDW
jgi:hypothetical protein